DVRVAGQRHRRRFGALTFLATDIALLAQILQPPPQQRDPPAGDAPVGLELGLARPACPDPAAESFEVLPHAAHAREVVLELCELYLQLALGADGVLSE